MFFVDATIFFVHFLATMILIAWLFFLPAKSKLGFILQGMSMLLIFSAMSMLAIMSLSANF